MNAVSQGYISNELIHFVGRKECSEEQQYQLLLKILQSGCLSNSEENAKKPEWNCAIDINGSGRMSQNEMYYPDMVCFCDIPSNQLKIHISKYSPFGIAFNKDFIVRKGGTPVYYLPLEAKESLSTKKGEYFDEIANTFQSYWEKWETKCPEVNGIIKEMKKFIDWELFSFVVFFDHTLADDDRNNYYFEREWRKLGNLDFNIDDIATILIPRNYKKRLGIDFPKYKGTVKTFPNE